MSDSAVRAVAVITYNTAPLGPLGPLRYLPTLEKELNKIDQIENSKDDSRRMFKTITLFNQEKKKIDPRPDTWTEIKFGCLSVRNIKYISIYANICMSCVGVGFVHSCLNEAVCLSVIRA